MTTAPSNQTQIPTSNCQTLNSAPASAVSDTPPHQLSDTFRSHRRKPRGKIAELPKIQRDLINQLLDQGSTYKAVCAEMAKQAVKLNPENVSNWFNTGYQVHVDHQLWLQRIVELRESASELCENYDPVKFHQAVNQLATVQIFKALQSLKFNDDPQAHTRMLNALARLGREALALKKAQDDADAEPMFNIPDDADAATPFSHLSNLLTRLKTPGSNQSLAPRDAKNQPTFVGTVS
jgi:hypothetical protein